MSFLSSTTETMSLNTGIGQRTMDSFFLFAINLGLIYFCSWLGIDENSYMRFYNKGIEEDV